MEHNIDFKQNYKGYGGSLFILCIMLHLVCVKAVGFHYNIIDLARRFNVDGAIGALSGVGSIATAVVLIQHYWLRNKMLRKELKEQREHEQHEEEKDNS